VRAPTQIEALSEWIVNLKYEDLPERIIGMAKTQVVNCMAAICAGSASGIGLKIKAALLRADSYGPCTLYPGGECSSLSAAVYFHAAMINALELDDFVFMGHVGQSAVSVPLALGEMLDSSGRDVLLALVAAEEAGGRLSACLASGPHQGHMRAFVHRCAAAIATAKLLGLNQDETSRAIAISLSSPEFPLYPASFSPDTKVTVTSSPSVEGVRAGMLAAEGMDASTDILEHPAGFFSYFSYDKYIPDIWKRVGITWTLDTLSVKEHATCAYAQGPVTACATIKEKHGIIPTDIEEVNVYGALVTLVLEMFSKPHLDAGLTPVNTTFSTGRSTAAALLYGGIHGGLYRAGEFEKRVQEIEEFSKKIRLRHDWSITVDLLRGLDLGIRNAGHPGFVSMDSGSRTFKRLQRVFGSRKLLELRDIPELLSLPGRDRAYFVNRYLKSIASRYIPGKTTYNRDKYFSGEGDLSKMSFRLGSRVEVRLKNGKILSEYCRIPNGFADSPDRLNVVTSKYFRETEEIWGLEKAGKIKKIIEDLDDHTMGELIGLIRNNTV